jgi:hypothetical protein
MTTIHKIADALRTKFVLAGREIEEPNRVEIDSWHRSLSDRQVIADYLESFEPEDRMLLPLALTVAKMARNIDDWMDIIEG